MSTPSVTVSKATFATVSAPASTVGVLAILAGSSTGTVNMPSSFARTDLAVTAFGYGPLTEFGAYTIAAANQPVVLCKTATTNAASYSDLVTTGITGTSVVTTSGTTPYDHYHVVITVVTGGTIGVAGITYTWSVDGGNITSGTTALGTSSTLSIANTGVAFALAAGTLVAGDTWSVYTERALANDADVLAAMQAMSRTRLPYEGMLIDCKPGSATVGVVDTQLATMEASGVFKFAVFNSRFKTEPAATGESEAAYLTALDTMFSNSTSIRVCVGADGALCPSPITAYNTKRPTSLFVAARAMQTGIGEDPAFIGRGPLFGSPSISDGNGNPRDHDEDLYPGIDAIRLTALRGFAAGNPQGVYINNANMIQPAGGSYPYLQFARIANRFCAIAWYGLTLQLSRGVRKNPKKDPNTGAVYIFEPDAALIDSVVNDMLAGPAKGQVSAYAFSVSRTDDMAANPCVITGILSVVAFAYVKGFLVTQQFNQTITTTV